MWNLVFCSYRRLYCGFPFFMTNVAFLASFSHSLHCRFLYYYELSKFGVFCHRGVQNRDQQQENWQVSNFIFSRVFWPIVIAGVFLSAMHFQKLRHVTDDLLRQIGILISLSSSASTVSLCKWLPHVSEGAERYFSDSHNLEKHLLLSGCSLISAFFGVKRKKVTLVWKFTVQHDYGFMFKAFSTINAACHDWCHDLEDFFPRKKTQARGIVVSRTVKRVLKMSALCLGFLTQCLFFYLLSLQNLYRLMGTFRWVHIIHD